MLNEFFYRRERWDERYQELRKQGKVVSCFTLHNLYVHPMHIRDYPLMILEKEKKSDIPVFWSVLHGVMEDFEWKEEK